MSALNVLVIDDEPAVRQILIAAVSQAGYIVDGAAGVAEATSKLKRGDFDVALCDINMQDGDGIDLLRQTQKAGIDTAFIMLTAFGSLETAVEALRAGAADYVVKPVRHQTVLHRLSQIDAMRGLRHENAVLRKAVNENRVPVLRLTSAAMLEVERLVCKVAPTDSTLLIVGESGTGKSVHARHVHEQSAHRDGQFVAVNCGAIPEQLIESELFGHTKGAFTGADKARSGLFVEADGGTIFLDEIGELPMQMQTKLLHVIEDKEVRAVGGERKRHVDCRIIAATNRNLAELIAQGRFREDLYFRLSEFQIAIPPLRDRRSDIVALIRFLLDHTKDGSRPGVPIEIDPDAEASLLAYNWPGNVRELHNVIKRARILCENNRITVAELPAEVVIGKSPGAPVPAGATVEGDLRTHLRRFEAGLIRSAIHAAGGDRRLAAQRLGISLSNLYSKLGEMQRNDETANGSLSTS